jgi:hypothetical protein
MSPFRRELSVAGYLRTRGTCPRKGRIDRVVWIYLWRGNTFFTAGYNEAPTLALDLNFLSTSPRSRIVATVRFIPHNILPAFPIQSHCHRRGSRQKPVYVLYVVIANTYYF